MGGSISLLVCTCRANPSSRRDYILACFHEQPRNKARQQVYELKDIIHTKSFGGA